MYRRILVPLDGTADAERALAHAEALAERFGAALTLLEATPVPPDVALAEAAAGGIPVPPQVVDAERVADAEHADAVSYLDGVVARLSGRGLTVDRALAEGAPADAIVEHAARIGADLIAMATHGRGGVGRLFFGSVAEDVLHRAPCPLLLVRVEAG